MLTDNTKITTKNWSKNKFQPTFNVKVYLQTKRDKIILSHITGLVTPTTKSARKPQPRANNIKDDELIEEGPTRTTRTSLESQRTRLSGIIHFKYCEMRS